MPVHAFERHQGGWVGRLGRPSKFSIEELQAAALALVDEEGLAGLSMRSLAVRLGTGPMTIYNYVRDRKDLDVLVVEAVIAEAKWARDRHEDWREDARRIVTALWRAVRAHPQAIPLILIRRNRSPALLDITEALLEALARGGRSGYRLLVAFRTVAAFVMGFAQAELTGPLAVEAGETTEIVTARTRALPPDMYPRVRELGSAATTSDVEREFWDGLDLILTGLVDGE
jgi:AcrR family transcriptional regulator